MVATALVAAAGAGASTRDEDALAQKYSPVVRLVEQPVECGPGEPYIPLDVDLLFGQPTVALRGPWNTTDLVKIGPSAQDLVNRFEYHLDYPGSALSPGCDYENWQRHLLAGGGSPTVYAHVATEPGHPGKVALQYWFFYVFNDFNNTHEGDWEMVQLDFDAADAAEALKRSRRRSATARTRAPSRPTGVTRSSSSSTGRTRSSTPRRGATRTSSAPPSTSAALRTRGWAATTPSGRTRRSSPS